MEQNVCKHNYGVECLDQSKCGTCGWDPETARRRLEAQKSALLKKRAVES